jgi:cell division transport system permease protein
MLDRIEFLIAEAYTSLKRNPWMTFASVTTVAMALYILGGIGTLYFSLSGHLDNLNRDFKLSVFLVDGQTEEQHRAIEAAIESSPGFASLTFVSKDAAFAAFRSENPDIPLDDFEEDNPLPDSFEVRLKNIGLASGAAESIRLIEGVEEVRDASEYRALLSQSRALLRSLGLILGSLMLITGGILIYNTILLTIYARRRELAIMRLVGAERLSVSGPLMIEGAVQGLIGGVLAAFLISLTLKSLNTIVKGLSTMGSVEPPSIVPMVIGLTFAGAVYGIVCSALAIHRQVKHA